MDIWSRASVHKQRRICAQCNDNMLTLFVEIVSWKFHKDSIVKLKKNGVPPCMFETIFGRPQRRVSLLRDGQMLSLSHGELIKHYTGVDNHLSPLLISLVAPCRILQTISKVIPSTAAPQIERQREHCRENPLPVFLYRQLSLDPFP